MTPPPVDSKAWDHYCTIVSPRPLSSRSNYNSKKYGERVTLIGEEMGCSVLDTYKLLGGDKGEDFYGKFLSDGLHLNEKGNRIVYRGIMEIIQSDFQHLLPVEQGNEGIPLEEKLWSDLC